MEKKTVLITGIGGNVGQGILRNLIKIGLPIRRVGCNTVEISAGNHLCDKTYLVPYATDSGYITSINEIVEKENVDLIIPSTDYEVYFLSKSRQSLRCPVATSSFETAEICLDKYKTYQFHVEYGLPFAQAFLPSEYADGTFDNFIVKPREGRGSRGIAVNPKNVSSYDDSYMIQELIIGQEITTAFYVDKNNSLHGFINLERRLDNGATNECAVNRSWDDQLEEILQKLVAEYNFSGSANIQSIVDKDGKIIPFEINCRISGTNSIRSNFGFEDVRYTVEEHLYNLNPTDCSITEGSAIRIMMDVIYPNESKISKLVDNSFEHYIF